MRGHPAGRMNWSHHHPDLPSVHHRGPDQEHPAACTVDASPPISGRKGIHSLFPSTLLLLPQPLLALLVLKAQPEVAPHTNFGFLKFYNVSIKNDSCQHIVLSRYVGKTG